MLSNSFGITASSSPAAEYHRSHTIQPRLFAVKLAARPNRFIWVADGQTQVHVYNYAETAENTVEEESICESFAAAAGNQQLDCAALSSNECVTEVNRNATGNQIPAPPDTSHNWISLRRLGGQLVGRLDPEPDALCGNGRARSTLRRANELSPWCQWIARGFSRPASRPSQTTTLSLESSAPQHYWMVVHSSPQRIELLIN
jgi:hypothetical protein